MAGINSLDDRILARILHIACYSVHALSIRLWAYKRLLPLAAVCSSWRRHACAYLYSTLIVEYQPPIKQVLVSKRKPPSQRKRSIWNGIGSSAVEISKTAVGPRWNTNMHLILHTNQTSKVTRLRIQMHGHPDYTGLVELLDFGHKPWPMVGAIELADFAELQLPLRKPAVTAAQQERYLENLTTHLKVNLPNVTAVTSLSWDVCATNKSLTKQLFIQYIDQLSVWNTPLALPLDQKQAPLPSVVEHLTVLQIETQALAQLGSAKFAVGQLQSLHLNQAEPFFSWAPFVGTKASSLTNNIEPLVFGSLHTLTIDFEKDNVANDTYRIDALRKDGRSSPRVTMGMDKRYLKFPILRSLTIRRVPYTYTSAWSMFLDSPLKSLSIAGKYAHVRYINCKLFEGLDDLDIHLYATSGAHGKFTEFIKHILEQPSTAKSAWIRHAEVFPLSVPDTTGWTNLKELNITAYIPTFSLLSLVSQLPQLFRLAVQRIARDASEIMLNEAGLLNLMFIRSRFVASTSIRELQLHMGGSQVRGSSLQAICYILTSMPFVQKLAVKQGYWGYVYDFIDMHKTDFPGLQNIQMVHHIYMQHIPAFLLQNL
ncbi:hypothetical protein BX070DRAFT_226599, partial [Coemansia spiralis]